MRQTREKSTRSTASARVAPGPVAPDQASDTPAPVQPLADASPEQPTLIDHRIRRKARHETPFVVRARNVKVGNPVAKSIYVAAATWCDVWEPGALGVCRPALDTIRSCTEWGRTAFEAGWQYLIDHNLASTRRGSRKKIIRIPDADAVIRAAKEPPSRGGSRTPVSRGFQPTVQGQDRSLGRSPETRTPRESPRTQDQQQQHSPQTTRAREARHVCECGHSWPASYGPTCNGCFKPITEPPTPQTRREVERAGRTHYARKVIAGRQEQEADLAPEKLISAIRARSAEHDVTFLEADVRRRIAAGKLTTADLLEYLNEWLPPRVNHASNESDPAHQRFLADDAAGRTDRSRKGGYPAPPDDPRFTTPYPGAGDDA